MKLGAGETFFILQDEYFQNMNLYSSDAFCLACYFSSLIRMSTYVNTVNIHSIIYMYVQFWWWCLWWYFWWWWFVGPLCWIQFSAVTANSAGQLLSPLAALLLWSHHQVIIIIIILLIQIVLIFLILLQHPYHHYLQPPWSLKNI